MKNIILTLALLLLCLVPVSSVSAQNVDDFRITNFLIDMKLSVNDNDNGSLLLVTETINAVFPKTDQNHGIERVFVKTYDGHSTKFNLISVKDGNGNDLNYHWEGDALRIGDADTFVHGSKSYVITYSQQDVTKYYKDTGKQEFYWDAVGVDWRVPIDNVAISLDVAESLVKNAETDLQCYVGDFDAKNKCDNLSGENGKYLVNVGSLSPRQGATLSLGFKENTFAEYKPTLYERFAKIFGIVQVLSFPLMVGALVWFGFIISKRTGRDKDLKTIVPEYLPPKGVSVTTAAQVLSSKKSIVAAQLVDLAVRHYIELYQTKEKTTFSPAQYEVKVIKDVSDLKWEEKELLIDMFGAKPLVGDKLNLKTLKNNTSYYNRTLNNDADLRKLVRGVYKLREKDTKFATKSRRISYLVAALGLFTVSLPFLFLAFVIFVYSFMAWRLTDAGLRVKQYLLGLKMYIEVAEEERIKLMQSPTSAKKLREYSDASKDTKQRMVLYEKVLPYAILFDQEKQWNKQLAHYYEQTDTQPSWYHSPSGAFSAASFTSGMNSLSSTANSSTSNYGGSSGGGSVGGGGGGGGGGGW